MAVLDFAWGGFFEALWRDNAWAFALSCLVLATFVGVRFIIMIALENETMELESARRRIRMANWAAGLAVGGILLYSVMSAAGVVSERSKLEGFTDGISLLFGAAQCAPPFLLPGPIDSPVPYARLLDTRSGRQSALFQKRPQGDF